MAEIRPCRAPSKCRTARGFEPNGSGGVAPSGLLEAWRASLRLFALRLKRTAAYPDKGCHTPMLRKIPPDFASAMAGSWPDDTIGANTPQGHVRRGDGSLPPWAE